MYFLKGGESSHKGGSPPFPTWQRPRFGNPACEVHAKSAQSDSFRAYRAEYAKWSYFPALPACWTYATLRRHKRQPKYRSEIHRAVYSEKAAYILCYNMESPKRNFHPSSAQSHHNIPIFANMVAWNARTMPSFAPATLSLLIRSSSSALPFTKWFCHRNDSKECSTFLKLFCFLLPSPLPESLDSSPR